MPATDTTGLIEATKSQEIRIDAAAPTVGITAPASGSSYSRRSTITVSASAVDRATGTASASGIARVVFYDGSRTLATVTTPVSGTSTYRFSWSPRYASTGWHSLTARATDVAGNATTSAAVQVYLRR